MKKEKIQFIINPISGAKSKEEIPGFIEQYIDSARFDYEIVYTEYRGHAAEIAAAAPLSGVSVIVAVGGDGTVNEIGKQLLYKDVAMAIVPTGSGNGLARHLRIPLDAAGAIRLINRNNKINIDACSANGQVFFCTAGIGFDAHIAHVFAANGKRGFITYIKSTLQEFRKYVPGNYLLKTRDKIYSENAFLITFANASQFGNNALIAPHADIQDGQMDICIMKKFPGYAAIDIGIKIFRGSIKNSAYVKFLKADIVTLKPESLAIMHLDGEPVIIDGEEIIVEVLPSSLRVISELN